MSIDPKDRGGKAVADSVLAQSREIVANAQAEEEQLSLLEPVTPEEMAEAQEELGRDAGNLTVLRHARAKRRGRPKGSRNKRTDDFARFILSYGQDPAITLMRIQSTPPEVLVQRSKDLDPVKRQMSYGDALGIIVRCAEALQPYVHSKRPVAVDMTFSGVSDLYIEGVTHTAEEMADVVEAEFMPVDDEPEGGE